MIFIKTLRCWGLKKKLYFVYISYLFTYNSLLTVIMAVVNACRTSYSDFDYKLNQLVLLTIDNFN